MYSQKQLSPQKAKEKKENIRSHVTLQSQAHWMLKSEYSKRLQNKNTLGVKKVQGQ